MVKTSRERGANRRRPVVVDEGRRREMEHSVNEMGVVDTDSPDMQMERSRVVVGDFFFDCFRRKAAAARNQSRFKVGT